MEMSQAYVDQAKVKGRPIYHGIKRLFDFLASLVALILLLPLFLWLAIKIRSEDGGPVFYSQIRIGKNEKPFRIYKFRSMVVNADKMKKELLDQNEVEGAMFKMHDDPRITKIGKFIRAHSLDELPQLWNVLIGNMSLVGPRPPLPNALTMTSSDCWLSQAAVASGRQPAGMRLTLRKWCSLTSNISIGAASSLICGSSSRQSVLSFIQTGCMKMGINKHDYSRVTCG